MVVVMYEMDGQLYNQNRPIPKEKKDAPRTWHVVVDGARGRAHRSRKLARDAARLERERAAA